MSQILDEKVNKLSESEKQLLSLRHTTEHVLHCAMQNLYPNLLKAMGPATPEGFYFDFDLSEKVSEEDFPKIEAEMQKLINLNLKMERVEISEKEAQEIFKNNPYKLEWVNLILERKEPLSIYKMIDSEGKVHDLDLCSGPHLESTKNIKSFKLIKIAGAYWHGDEKNKMLSRIYGVAFPSNEELDKYLWQVEEAKKRDHRVLGEKLNLFAISEEVGRGLVLWLPNGNIIKEELETWAKKTEATWGYKRVTTPNITKAGLYYTSGHLPYYKDDMYPPMKFDDGEEYYLKPMNCPHHHMIFKARQKSYKDLPLRLAEFGTCYRYEASGQLFGLMRLRGFTQNDSHIYCTVEQAVDEFLEVMKLHEYYYKALGINKYHLVLSLRDPKNLHKYHGDEKMWELAEKLMREAVKKTNLEMVEDVGGAAFYGPKIDFVIHSSIGREFAISTNQIDLFMGERFKLKYIDQDGKEQTPVIIHRAPLGSHERFIGFLIEHFGGAFPLWLSPVQAVLIPISEKQEAYAKKIESELKNAGLRVENWNQSESMQKRIKLAQEQKIPYMVILGGKEEEQGKISLRKRDGTQENFINLADFITRLKSEIEQKTIN
jgi:threonyl-tRNA synthetase